MDNFCRIFIYTEMSKDNILLFLSMYYKKDVYIREISLDKFSISLTKNELYSELKAKEFPDGFLYFPFSLEVEFDADVSDNFVIQNVENLLIHFWENDIPAIASCDYEHLLKNKGGYKSKNIPWPN